MVPVSSKEFLDIRTYIECGFTLKRVRNIIKTYSQFLRTDNYSQHSSIFWPVWLNGWVFVYEISGCGFESCCNHLSLTYGACFEQGVPEHSGKYRVWIDSKTRTWHDKNIQSLFKSFLCKSSRKFTKRGTLPLVFPIFGNFWKWMPLGAPSKHLGTVVFDVFQFPTVAIFFSCYFL